MKQISAEEISKFCREHNAPMAKWDWTQLVHWVSWACSEGFVIPITSDWKTMDGLAIARPAMQISEMNDPYQFDLEGKFIYVDLAIALKPEILRCITIALVKRFGMREGVFWHRRRDQRTLHGYSAQRVVQKLLRKEPTETRG